MKAKFTGSLTLEVVPSSPYYLVYFTDASGKRKHKSTKVPHAGGMFRGEKLTANQAKIRAAVVAQEIAERSIERDAHAGMTIEEAVRWHLRRKAKNVKMSSFARGARTLDLFLDWLGSRKNNKLDTITRKDIEGFLLSQWGGARNGTKRLYRALICAFFNDCLRGGVIEVSPGAGVDIQLDRRPKKITKNIFTQEQLKDLFERAAPIYAAAAKICLGTYGQRIGDIVALKWDNVDFARRVVKITTSKTKTELEQPMQKWFFDWMAERKKTSKTETVLGYSKSSSSFSRLFSLEMLKLGLAEKVKGQGAQRAYTTRTFHCLRATAVTMLHAAGVPETLAMKLVGHSSRLVHAIYCRPTIDQLARAAEKLPEW